MRQAKKKRMFHEQGKKKGKKETVFKKAQALDLSYIDFKSAVLNILKEMKETEQRIRQSQKPNISTNIEYQ